MNLFLILFVIVESMMKNLNNDRCRAISFVLLCTLQNIYIGKYNTESYDNPPQKKTKQRKKKEKLEHPPNKQWVLLVLTIRVMFLELLRDILSMHNAVHTTIVGQTMAMFNAFIPSLYSCLSNKPVAFYVITFDKIPDGLECLKKA